MSPRKLASKSTGVFASSEHRLWLEFGSQIRVARLAKGWSVPYLAHRAEMSPSTVYLIESGGSVSTEAATRLAVALGRRVELTLVDPRRRDGRPSLSGDLVHSAMGEFEAAHLSGPKVKVGLDEPYQHYQFAGRADLVAWDVDARALLHIENRTRFPDFQEMAGAFNAKRAYLGEAIAERVGVTSWRSQTHVIAALWSSEILQALRLRRTSFQTLCPDGPQAFADWWNGARPPVGAHSMLIVLDPVATGRRRQWIALNEVPAARPRYRGYAEAAATLARNGAIAAASSSG